MNRFERKKNIPLALESFANYLNKNREVKKNVILVVAGGYDPRLTENVEHHLELETLARKLNINDRTVFLRSITNDQRLLLLENTSILLYTPENEHFGIVPVEAMYMGAIVIACNSGGPLESVDHGKTGYLLPPKEEEWGNKIDRILNSSQEEQEDMKAAAKEKVKRVFTFEAFADQLDELLQRMVQEKLKQ